jgi:plastocyanin
MEFTKMEFKAKEHSFRTAAAIFAAAVLAGPGLMPALAQAYQVVAVPNGGTIEGKVVFQGSAPLKKIIPTKDKEVCGGLREEPQIVLAQDGGVQDALVYLKEVKAGKAWAKLAKPTLLDNLKCQYLPHMQAIPVGSTLVIGNSDPVLHTVHCLLGKETLFNRGFWRQGQQIKKQFEKPGLVLVNCDSHGWMEAWVYVADNPYYAITAKDGTFTLRDVPPGTYTLFTWHEYTGGVEMPVSLKAKEAVRVTIELKK